MSQLSVRNLQVSFPLREGRLQAVETPFSKMEKSEQVRFVTEFLQSLKPEYREVIVLREYQNLSYEEIAAVTRSTISAVKSRLFKARRKLARVMEPLWDEAPPTPAARVDRPDSVPVRESKR